MEVSAKNAWGKKNCLTPAFLAHTGFFFKISTTNVPWFTEYESTKEKGCNKIAAINSPCQYLGKKTFFNRSLTESGRVGGAGKRRAPPLEVPA